VTPVAVPAAAGLAAVDDPAEQGRFTQWVVGAGGERLAESALQLSGLHCAACAGLIEQALMGVAGVRSAAVNASAQRASVRWDPALARASALIEAVRRAGYDAVPDAAAPARALRQAEHRQALWRLFVASFCAMQIMMMATPSYVAGPGELAPDMRQLLNWGSWLLALPVMLFSAGPLLSGAWRGLRARRIGMDVPVALALVITFVASTGATFNPEGVFGHEVFFDSLAMFVSFLLGARYVELLARHRAAQGLEQAMARLPAVALRMGEGGALESVSVHSLRPGDAVRVPVGEAFAADGVVCRGHTQADESLLTGESAPVDKAQGAEVVGGSINVGAPVDMTVLRVGQDTRFQAIVSMMRSAMGQRPAAARVADRWAAPFLWAVLVLAAGAAAVWSAIDPSRAVWVAVSVLIVTCPCALSLAAPATLVAAARGMARRGVMLQNLDAVEQLARADHFFFDKTGTLTEDRLQLRQVTLSAAASSRLAGETHALALAASLARYSRHPMAGAIVAAASAAEAPVRTAWTDVQEVPGQGLQARDSQGAAWRLGSAAWMWGADTVNASPAQVWLGCEGQVLAAFALDERLRDGALQALQALQAQGLQVTLLSGDTAERATRLAQHLGLQGAAAVLGGATPQDKLDAVARAQAAGQRVAMVGDGINDAPVLARADVSLAMGQGALVSRSQADAVVTSSRLTDIVRARASARHALRIVRQNMVWAAAYNAVCVPLALMGWLPPWAAGLGMAASSMLVVFNALRAAKLPSQAMDPGVVR
jgi:Cu2+-exporting ATPase